MTAERPSPYALWQQAKGDKARYRALLIEHGHLIPTAPMTAEPLVEALRRIADHLATWEHGEECEAWGASESGYPRGDEGPCDCGLGALIGIARAALDTTAPEGE